MSQMIERRPTKPVAARMALVGRDEPLATILRSVEDGSAASVVFIHGIAGIGKSTLLAACLDEARASHNVVTLDGRSVEPTEAGFLDALGRALDLPGSSDPRPRQVGSVSGGQCAGSLRRLRRGPHPVSAVRTLPVASPET
jgi:ATP/maltotriose-dependent transcriptional regulator MalT